MNQPTLFETNPAPLPVRDRSKQIASALKNQGEAFRKNYEKFVLEYARTHDDFLAEEIAAEYKETELPKPADWRGSGGIFRKLVLGGKLIKTGDYRQSKGGERPMIVYRAGKI